MSGKPPRVTSLRKTTGALPSVDKTGQLVLRAFGQLVSTASVSLFLWAQKTT